MGESQTASTLNLHTHCHVLDLHEHIFFCRPLTENKYYFLLPDSEQGFVIVAGDTEIGQNALVTLFSDPYSLGYAAGKKAIKVFNEEDIKTIKIGSVDGDDSVKLYNGEIAEKYGKEFPKSFKEINEFLETYEYGSTTTRYSATGEE